MQRTWAKATTRSQRCRDAAEPVARFCTSALASWIKENVLDAYEKVWAADNREGKQHYGPFLTSCNERFDSILL